MVKKNTWFPPGFPGEKNMVSSRFYRRKKHGFLQIFPDKKTWFPPDFPEEKNMVSSRFPRRKKHGLLQIFPKKITWFPPGFPEEKTMVSSRFSRRKNIVSSRFSRRKSMVSSRFSRRKKHPSSRFSRRKKMVSSRFSRQILCFFLTFSHSGPVWRQVSRATPTVVVSADPSGPGFRWTKCAPSLSPSMMATNHGKMLLHVWYIYLQNWVIFRVNVGNYSIHGAYGNVGTCGKILYKWR